MSIKSENVSVNKVKLLPLTMLSPIAIFLCLTLPEVFKRSNAECQPQIITCPCGRRDTFARVAVRLSCEEMQKGHYPCTAFENCETCQDGYNFCRTCPVGRSGLYCNGGEKCPKLQPPKSGIVQCSYNDVERECTGICNPGYSFLDGKVKMTLSCNSGTWSSFSSFPQCEPTNECDIEVKSKASYSCRTTRQGTSCDIKCYGSPPINSGFLCVPGQGWIPPLPYCVTRKETASSRNRCNCLNGGSCNPFTLKCTCPSEYEGKRCQKKIEVTSPAPRCDCRNGGFCEPSTSACICPPFYEGKFCEKRKYNGRCSLDLKKEGSFNCTYNKQGISCDIRCLQHPPTDGRFNCDLQKGWNLPLPSCVTEKKVCQCGLELVAVGTHRCESNNYGYYCDIRCLGSDQSSGRYYCLPGVLWNPSLPYCVKKKPC